MLLLCRGPFKKPLAITSSPKVVDLSLTVSPFKKREYFLLAHFITITIQTINRLWLLFSTRFSYTSGVGFEHGRLHPEFVRCFNGKASNKMCVLIVSLLSKLLFQNQNPVSSCTLQNDDTLNILC